MFFYITFELSGAFTRPLQRLVMCSFCFVLEDTALVYEISSLERAPGGRLLVKYFEGLRTLEEFQPPGRFVDETVERNRFGTMGSYGKGPYMGFH